MKELIATGMPNSANDVIKKFLHFAIQEATTGSHGDTVNDDWDWNNGEDPDAAKNFYCMVFWTVAGVAVLLAFFISLIVAFS